MADLKALIQALRDTADELDEEIPLLLLEQEVTAKSLVQNRIQETGKDSKGGQLGQYSNTEIPAIFFLGKGSKSTDAKLKKLSKEGRQISYGDFRELDGKQDNYVDLTFSGRMWKDTGLIKKQSSKTNTVIVIGQTTPLSKEKADDNEDRYGNFMELSDEELAELTEVMAEEVEEIIEKNLGGL